MADFRKLLFVLIAGALLFTTVAGAAEYGCRAHADPVLVRSEGIAEKMGDVLLECGGAVPAGGIRVNIRLKLTANITSNPFDSTPVYNEATLILDSGADGFRGYDSVSPVTRLNDGTQNVYQAVRISDDEIEWQGVTLAAVNSTGAFTSIRMTNVRGNVQARGDFATIYATVNFNPSAPVPVDNNLVVVADTRPGLEFSVDAGNLKNCVFNSYGWSAGSAEEDIIDPFVFGYWYGYSGVLHFKEGFGDAFKPKGPDTGTPPPPRNATPGGAYRNESGFTVPSLAAGALLSQSTIGKANYGTRLFARLSDVPTGVKKIYAPSEIHTAEGMVLLFVESPTALSTVLTSAGADGTLSAGGLGNLSEVKNSVIAYEVVSISADSADTVETVDVPLVFTYDPTSTGTRPIGTTMVKGSLAPLSTVFTMSKTAPEPRFVDKATAVAVLTISPCRTILLFPYITNQALFDTGIAIANTSKDPLYEDITSDKDPLYIYKTVAQAGACKLHYFGNTSNGPGPADQTTPVIPAGGHLVFQLSGGGGVFAQNGGFTACASGQCIAPLYQGYLFAVCDFQFAHGYAFISDYGSQKLAQGYLALIVPDFLPYGRVAGSSGYYGYANTGETLTQ